MVGVQRVHQPKQLAAVHHILVKDVEVFFTEHASGLGNDDEVVFVPETVGGVFRV